MRKTSNTRTVTTLTIDPALDKLDPEDMAELSKPYVWESETAARLSIRIMQRYGDTYRVVEHEAPGLSVFAVYRRAHHNAEATILMSVIVFEDDDLSRLHTAVRKQRPVTVTYVKADGEEVVRTIEPRSLRATKNGDVIVKALDRKSGEHRSFRTDRITAYTVHRTPFVIDEAYVATIMEARHAVPVAGYRGTDAPAPELFTWTETVNGKTYTVQGTAPAPELLSTDPDTAAALDEEALLDTLAAAWAQGESTVLVAR